MLTHALQVPSTRAEMEPALTAGMLTLGANAQDGVLEDFESVMRLHWPRVFRFALASLRDQDAAETLAQDCFLRAYRARGQFRGESTVQTWLMQIAVNLIRDHARSRKMQFWKQAVPVDGELASRAVGAERQILARERVEAVWKASAELPERQRTVFLLRFVEEMELLEICAVTGLSEGAVKVHLFRALRTVRRLAGRLK